MDTGKLCWNHCCCHSTVHNKIKLISVLACFHVHGAHACLSSRKMLPIVVTFCGCFRFSHFPKWNPLFSTFGVRELVRGHGGLFLESKCQELSLTGATSILAVAVLLGPGLWMRNIPVWGRCIGSRKDFLEMNPVTITWSDCFSHWC